MSASLDAALFADWPDAVPDEGGERRILAAVAPASRSSSRLWPWATGLSTLAFVVYHLLHFTFGAVHAADAGLKARPSTAAWAGHDEGEVGRLAPGLRADFVVLDRDPLAIPAAELDDLKIQATWVDGQPVYEAGP